MNILILSSSHPYKSAGVVALDLFKEFGKDKENNVKLITLPYDDFLDKNICSIHSQTSYLVNLLFQKFRKYIKLINGGGNEVVKKYSNHTFNDTKKYFTSKRILEKTGFIPDRIIVLFMPNFLTFKNIYELNEQTGAKIYLYPMDMAPFTGGCHHAWDCNGYKKQCGYCPAIQSNDPYDQSYRNWKYKKQYLQKTEIAILSVNTEITEQLRESTLFSEIEIIEDAPFVPAKEIFFPRGKIKARKRLGISDEKKVLFFGATSLSREEKGMLVLLDAMNILAASLYENNYNTKDLLLLIAGSNINQIKGDLPFDNKYIGFVKDYNDLAIAYSASNFFVSPSLDDVGPTMVLQSIFCGTPVISFNIGYAKDFVNNRVNGFKSKSKSAKELASVLLDAIMMSQTEYENMRSENLSIFTQISQEKVLRKIMETT